MKNEKNTEKSNVQLDSTWIVEVYSQLVDTLGIKPNEKILDLGCGYGAALKYILPKIDENGVVVGIDRKNASLARAKITYSDFLKNKKLILKRKDFSIKIPFGDDTFNKILCHNVLECLQSKIKLINECHRVLEVEGELLLSHFDFDTVVINNKYKNLNRKLVHFYADYTQDWQDSSDGQIGRKLQGFFSKSNFEDFDMKSLVFIEHSFTEGTYGHQYVNSILEMVAHEPCFDQNEVKKWREDLVEKNKNGDFYFSINLNSILARKHR